MSTLNANGADRAAGRRLTERIAGAPISWGVCEVPGWGYQLGTERVLTEMGLAGLVATEFGPDGFLPEDPHAKAELLASYGLRAVGGFVPVVLHDTKIDPLPEIEAALAGFTAADAGVMVLAAASGLDGYDERPELDADGWRALCAQADRIAELAARFGVLAWSPRSPGRAWTASWPPPTSSRTCCCSAPSTARWCSAR